MTGIICRADHAASAGAGIGARDGTASAGIAAGTVTRIAPYRKEATAHGFDGILAIGAGIGNKAFDFQAFEFNFFLFHGTIVKGL